MRIYKIFFKSQSKQESNSSKVIVLEEKIVSFATSVEDQVHPLQHLEVVVTSYTTLSNTSKFRISRNN